MTSSDLLCEDLDCEHVLEIPLSDDRTRSIIAWRCRCGANEKTIAEIDAERTARRLKQPRR